MEKKVYLIRRIFWCIIVMGNIVSCYTCYAKKSPYSKIRIFNSLAKIEQWADAQTECPMPNTNNWKDPDFSSFQKHNLPGSFKDMIARYGILHPLWSQYSFKKILKAVVNTRKKQGYTGRFVQKIYLKPTSTVIILGTLYGAFHSLTRDLQFLKHQGIIDEHLKITKPDCIIIFNGNVVANSAYILETVTIILRLMLVNPDTAFYIKGEQEDYDTWKKDGLKRELQIRASYYKNGTIPLSRLINKLFHTLPLAVYLVADQTQTQIDVVRISSYEQDTQELNESNFADFFSLPREKTLSLDKPIYSQSKIAINVPVFLQSALDQIQLHRNSHGLALVSKDKQTIVWNIFSSPVGANRALYQFFYDSFVIITTNPLLKDWTVTLYEQDVRKKLGIKPYAIENLLTGVEYINKEIQEELIQSLTDSITKTKTAIEQIQIELGIVEKVVIEKPVKLVVPPPVVPKHEIIPPPVAPLVGEIKFGSSMDLTRGVRDLGLQLRAGIELVFNEQNKKGGIDNKKLVFIALDDEYTPRKARANIETLLKIYKVNKLLMTVGTPTLNAYFYLVKQGKILVLFTSSGSPTFRDPQYKYIIHYRSSFTREGEVLARYARETLKAKKIVLFYQSDVPSIEGAVEYFKKTNFTDYIKVVYKRHVAKMNEQVALITKENPDAIIFLAIPTAATELIRQLGVENVAGKNLLGWSDLAGELFQKFIRQKGLKFITSNIVPSPLYSQLPLIKEFRKLTEQQKILQDTFSLEGFICARIVIAILKKIKGPITKEKIIEIAEAFRDFDLGGLHLTFNPQTRELCPTVWIDTGVGDWQPITFEVPKAPPKPPVAIEKGVFTVATTLDLSRGIKAMGTEIKRSTEAVFEQANNVQKIPDVSLRLVALDDEYDPQKARENVEQIIKQKISNILISHPGSQTFATFKDLVKEGKILVLFPIPGVPGNRKPDLTYCIYFRPSYIDEVNVLTRYALQRLKPRKVVIFYQDDLLGKTCLEEAKKMFDDAKLTYIELPYGRNDVNFDEQIKVIKKENPDTICLFAVPNAAKILLKGLGDQLLLEKNFLGISDLGHRVFKKFAKTKGLKYIISNIVPDPEESTLSLVKQYRTIMKRYGIPIDTFSLEAYINASILVDTLSRMKKSFTKQNIIAKLEAMSNYNLGGLKLTFNRKTRQLSNTIWLDTGKGKWKPETFKAS